MRGWTCSIAMFDLAFEKDGSKLNRRDDSIGG
jgi:hypothetical protein